MVFSIIFKGIPNLSVLFTLADTKPNEVSLDQNSTKGTATIFIEDLFVESLQ